MDMYKESGVESSHQYSPVAIGHAGGAQGSSVVRAARARVRTLRKITSLTLGAVSLTVLTWQTIVIFGA